MCGGVNNTPYETWRKTTQINVFVALHAQFYDPMYVNIWNGYTSINKYDPGMIGLNSKQLIIQENIDCYLSQDTSWKIHWICNFILLQMEVTPEKYSKMQQNWRFSVSYCFMNNKIYKFNMLLWTIFFPLRK